MRPLAVAVVAAALSLAACGGEGEDSEGPLMAPGSNCVGCHGFTAAGTVFASAGSTQGVAGVNVRILTSGGAISRTLVTNEAGNFFTSATLPVNFGVELERNGNVVTMSSSPQAGCNGCHDATFRLVAP